MTRKAGEMKKLKTQARRKSISQGNMSIGESTDAVLTRRQAAQLTHQTRSKDKMNKIVRKGELSKKSRDRKVLERKKKILLNLKKDRYKSGSLDKLFQRNKSNQIGTASSANQSAGARKPEQNSIETRESLEEANSIHKPETVARNLTLTASKSKSLLDRSKVMLERELRAARKQIRKPIRVLDGPEECYRKGLNGSKDTNEKSAPQGLIENEERCPGFDKFGRPMTDIPDVVIMKEELEDIDEDDIMDIVLCPSPVWWEEPVDEELKTMYKKEGECTASGVPGGGSCNGDKNKKKSFALEKILENIRLKNIHSVKKNCTDEQNNIVGATVALKTSSASKDVGNEIGNMTENTSVLGARVNVSENISDSFIATEVQTEKVVSDFQTTSAHCSKDVQEHGTTLLEDMADEEVARFTRTSSAVLEVKYKRCQKATNNDVKGAKNCMEYVVDLTLDDEETDSNVISLDTDATENENQDLNIFEPPSEMESVFGNKNVQNENDLEINLGATDSSPKRKSNKQVKDIARCTSNHDNKDIKTENLKSFAEREKPDTLIVFKIGKKTSIEETEPTGKEDRAKDVELILDQNELELRLDLGYEDFDRKESVASKENSTLNATDITTSNSEEEDSTPERPCINIETKSKETPIRAESISVPTIDIDIGKVIQENENFAKLVIKQDLNEDEKSIGKDGNKFKVDEATVAIDEEINVNVIIANTIKKENLLEIDSRCTEFQKNIEEMEFVNLVQIPIRNNHVQEKRYDVEKSVSQENIEKNSLQVLNKSSTLNLATTISLNNWNDLTSKSTADREVQEETSDKELKEISMNSASSETSMNVPNLLSTDNEEPNVSLETEKFTENEASVYHPGTNVEIPEDKAKKIREEIKVIQEGLRMAQQIQKLSESHLDCSKRNKLLELSSELLETLKSSMHELKDADDSEILDSDKKKEIILKPSEKSTEANVELENLTNPNVCRQTMEDIAVCTLVSDNLKKQVKERDLIVRSQKIRNTYLGIVESSYIKNKIIPTEKSEIISNLENDGWKHSLPVSTGNSFNSASELSSNESSNSEAHFIERIARKNSLNVIPISADKVQKLPLNCESLNTNSEVSANDPICGATPISTSPKADFLQNYLPSDASKICDADNSSNISCSRSIAEIPQESAKRLPSISEINITEIITPDVPFNSVKFKIGKNTKVIGKLKNFSGDFKRKNTFVPRHLNNINAKIRTFDKSKAGKFRNLRISKKRNVRMKSTSSLYDGSTRLQENADEYETKILVNSTGNSVSVNFDDMSSKTNKQERYTTAHEVELKTENENSESESSYDDILKSLQSLIDENNGSASVVEPSENRTSRETDSKSCLEVLKPNSPESSLNLNGSEIALADLKAIANGQNRNTRKLSPQKYVEMDKLVIMETAFKSTSISQISKHPDFETIPKKHYVEMDSLLIMDSQRDTLTPKLEELIPSNETCLEISSESLKKIREILGIPEFDHSTINVDYRDDITNEKSYTEVLDGNLNGENEDKKLVECGATVSLECTETFDPKMDLCDTLGIPYLEYSRDDVKCKSSFNLKDGGIIKNLPPIESVDNNVGKENLDNAIKMRDMRTKRKRVDYKQLARGIRHDSSDVTLKRIKTVNTKETSGADGDTKSLTQDMIANIIGVDVTPSGDDKLDNIYFNIDPNLYKNMCKHRKRQSEAQCQKCTLRFTYNSCIKLLSNTQSDSDSRCSEGDCKSVTSNKFYKCGQCDYVCARRDNLRTHFRKHTNERPFDCSVCDHKARTKDHLTRHQRTHDNLPKDDWRKSHREAQKMISGCVVKIVPEEVFRDHSYARH